MILDRGMLTVFHGTEAAEPGRKPVWTYSVVFQGWYGELNYETSPARPTEGRKETRTDKRVRILRCEKIREDDVVVLSLVRRYEDLTEETPVYKVGRRYHGTDDDSPTPITDMNLEVYTP